MGSYQEIVFVKRTKQTFSESRTFYQSTPTKHGCPDPLEASTPAR